MNQIICINDVGKDPKSSNRLNRRTITTYRIQVENPGRKGSKWEREREKQTVEWEICCDGMENARRKWGLRRLERRVELNWIMRFTSHVVSNEWRRNFDLYIGVGEFLDGSLVCYFASYFHLKKKKYLCSWKYLWEESHGFYDILSYYRLRY